MLSDGGIGEALIYPVQGGVWNIETGAVLLANGKRVYINGSTDAGKAYLKHRSTTDGAIFTKL